MKKTILAYIIPLLIACSPDNKSAEHTDHNKEEARAVKYTCPMHPNVVRDGPGKCPVCGMDLVQVNKSDDANSLDLMLSDSQMRLANITTQKVSVLPIGQTAVVNGRLVENQDLSEVISSRASGRIEKLYIKDTGKVIRKGEPLYQLYSETLLTLQREYLLAKEQFESLGSSEKRYKSFLDASKRKLTLYGLTNDQIEKLGKLKDVQSSITFLSPATGVVSEILVAEGQYITEGALLMKIEDVSKLWIEAELYPAETSLAKVGDNIRVQISGYENNTENAVINFLSPEFRINSQITVMRATLSNPQLKYKPGMQAQVFFTRSSKKSLAIPVDAVIRDGRGTHVYIQHGHNTFRPQRVKTGLEDFETVEIIEGINEGDTVAITGAYLLYSEIILKKGKNPMADHNH